MSMRYITRLIVLFGIALTGCSQQPEPGAGSEGGACRIGPEACNEGLTCRNGACRTTTEDDELASISVRFNIRERQIPADGKAKVVVLLTATTGQKASPFDGKLRLFPSPSTAGLVRWIPDEGELPEPTRVAEIQFDSEGNAVAEYLSCHRGRVGPSDCPEFVFLSVARSGENTPLTPIARSESIKLTGRKVEPSPALDPALCAQPGVFVVVPNPKHDGSMRTKMDGAGPTDGGAGGMTSMPEDLEQPSGGTENPGESAGDMTNATEDDGVLTVDESVMLIQANASVQRDNNEVSVIGPGINITMRVNLGGGGTGRRTITTRDAVVKSGESLGFKPPCNDPTALVWSGFFDAQTVGLDGGKLTALKSYFELICADDTQKETLIQGCIMVEEKMDPAPMGGAIPSAEDNDMTALTSGTDPTDSDGEMAPDGEERDNADDSMPRDASPTGGTTADGMDDAQAQAESADDSADMAGAQSGGTTSADE